MLICATTNGIPECDMETSLSCPDEQKAYLTRLTSNLQNFRTKLKNYLDEESNKCKGTSNELEQNVGLISQLSNEVRSLEAKLDSQILEEKVINKKIKNSIALVELLKEDIDREKAQRETLTLEMVDLQQELMKQKETKKKQWNAIKMAIAVYKDKLNIHIEVQHHDDHDTLVVAYFHNVNPNRDNYYVVLVHSHNVWRVTNIQPPLKDKYLTEIKLDFSRDYESLDISGFLCKIRDIFLKYYVSHK